MSDKIRQAAVECAKECVYASDRVDNIERAMRKLVDAQPVESRHVPALTFGAGEFSCAVCGLGMEKPCEHWKQMLILKVLPVAPSESPTPASEEELVCKIAASFYKVDKTTVRTHYLPIIRAYVAERTKEKEQFVAQHICGGAMDGCQCEPCSSVHGLVDAEREACAKIADEDFTLDEHTPCDEGHREFYKKYGTAEVCEAIRARGSSNALKEYIAERVREAERQGGWVEHQKWCQYCCGNGDGKPKCSDGWALYAEAKR